MPKQSVAGFALAVVTLFYFYAVSIVEALSTEMPPASQTSSQGGVKIIISPHGFSSEAKTWDFAITLETHTRPLDDDFVKSSVLFGDGKSYRPLGWDGDPSGGHHRKGSLRFKGITPRPDAVELQIRRSGEANPRIFRWQLK